MASDPFRIGSAAHKADPYPFYARLRDEAPVSRVRPPDRRSAWLVARHVDVAALLKDARFAKDHRNALTPEQLARTRQPPRFVAPLMQSMIDRDDPDHARLRRLAQAAFTPRRMALLEVRAQETCDALIARIGPASRFDLIASLALPMPVAVIAEMLGVAPRDRPRFARWSRAIVGNPMTPLGMVRTFPPLFALVRFLRRLVAQRRREPADDLVSALVGSVTDDERATDDELVATIALLLTAGHETTVNLIGNGMLALLRSPRQLERMRDDPAAIDTAIEELLRYDSPVEWSTPRYAREDLEIAGVRIGRGERVFGAIASANRDASVFEDAETLDVGRTPNRHLTFGQGGHYCLGAALARMEGRVAFRSMLRSWPGLALELPDAALRWRGGLILRGLEALPLTTRR